MYQRNINRSSFGESVIVSRHSDKAPKLERAPSLDSLGSGGGGSRGGEGSSSSHDDINHHSRRNSVKMDYMEEYQEIRHPDDLVDDISDLDSIEDAQEGNGGGRLILQAAQVQIHAKQDLDFEDDETAAVQSEIPKDPVVTAYLEKANHICQNNCVKSMVQFNARDVVLPDEDGRVGETNGITEDSTKAVDEEAIIPNSGSLGGGGAPVGQQGGSGGKNRRTSLSSGSVGRMETIIEEPIEAKVSVKEILARFETLRESAEVQSKASTVSSGTRASAIINANVQQANQMQQHHGRSDQDAKSSRTRRRSMSPSGGMETGRDMDYEQNGNNYHHQSMSALAELHHQRNSINHQDVVMAHDSPYGKEMGGDFEENGMHVHNGHNHMNGGGSTSKYSLLQFAALRQDSASDESKASKSNEKRLSTGSRPNIDLVKWQANSLKTPLLRLPPDLAALALECFDCILRYCGDLMVDVDLTEVKCVYTILMHCHKHLALRDEVYCQLMKQTTTNRSPNPESVQRAWRLMSILAAYFSCSDALRPYLMEHLSTAASDRRRACHGTAAVCLTNLRKTARCGGRKNVPSVEEVTAVSAGRSARRQIYRLPGGAERVVNTRCSTVVADVIAELCTLLGIESEAEQQEFSLYCIVQGDAFTMPLASDEYILDVTTELLKSGQPFYLIFCRSVWHFPLKREPMPAPLYIEVLFNQVAPDYLEGLLLELAHGNSLSSEMVRDMARIAALLHRAADLSHVPAMKEIKFLLPKPALGVRDIKPSQWVSFVQSAWPSVAGLSPNHVKAQFLVVLSSWPLFGSSFFAVKRVFAEENMEEASPLWRELILALNRKGVLFLDPNTHETVQHYSFPEVISTRKVRSEDGALFLDMKVGNLMQQRVIRVQTEQAHEISRLVRQYITMAQAHQKDRRD